MGHVPDHTPAAAAAEHAALIVAFDAGDLAGSERDGAVRLAAACAGCATLLADLAAIRAATAALPAPARTKDYRLTEADAARLRPTAWAQLVAWLGAPRSTVRPLAGALATLGIVGLLLGTTPGLFGPAATTLSTAAVPGVAPGLADGTSGASAGSAPLDLAPSPVSGPSAAAGFMGAAPAASPEAGGAAASPGLAALPAPSPASVAVPAESPVRGNIALPASTPPDAGVVTGPAAAGPPGSSAPVPLQGASKAAAPEAPGVTRSAPAQSAAPLEITDRTPLVAGSLILLLAALGLYGANRALRRGARG